MAASPYRLEFVEVAPEQIRATREDYRQEMVCQIVHDSFHQRGFSRCFAFQSLSGNLVGHGCLVGVGNAPKAELREFYVQPECRPNAETIFQQFLAHTQPATIVAQSNDPHLYPWLQKYAHDIKETTVVFDDPLDPASLACEAVFRAKTPEDHGRIFLHTVEPEGDYLLELNGDVVATGGYFTHYNPPFVDVYMEVDREHHRKGYGAYLVQRIMEVVRQRGLKACARCPIENLASHRTLLRAGFKECARIFGGTVAPVR